MMIIAIDAGNTNITLGVVDDYDNILFTARFSTDKNKTTDEYAVFFKTVLELHEIKTDHICGGIISSVVPPLTNILRQAVEVITGVDPIIVGSGIKTGLNILIDNPKQLGSDLVVDAIAAISNYKTPLIILDLGTATTLSAIDEKKNYVGGVIAPGLKISHEALTNGTSQLPNISLEAPATAIGKNTIEAMQSGLVYGHSAMLDGMIDRLRAELDGNVTVVATGGLAKVVLPYCKHKIIYDNDLLIKGLMILYKKNRNLTKNT